MRRPDFEPMKIYRHNDLILELNDMMIRLKIHLYHSDNEKLVENHPKPTSDELDEIQSKINRILQKDWDYLVKY